eukprot:scaffold9691_cov113-Isochrysis_galbana.AAC.1
MLSNRSAPSKKPPWRTRKLTASPVRGYRSSCQRIGGTSERMLLPVADTRRTDVTPRAPFGRVAPNPQMCAAPASNTFDRFDGPTRTRTTSVAVAERPSKYEQSWRAVGRLPSSTEPSESRPASIKGTSASTMLPDVCFTKSKMVSNPIAGAMAFDAVDGAPSPAFICCGATN